VNKLQIRYNTDRKKPNSLKFVYLDYIISLVDMRVYH